MSEIDWTKSMQQTFRYFVVHPGTWRNERELLYVTSSSIKRDSDEETLGSGSFETTEELGECYVRTYLVCIQNGIKEEIPLGTLLVQTPGKSYNGRVQSLSMDAYTPLLELKDKNPPFGYSISSGVNVLKSVSTLVADNARAPVVPATSSDTLNGDYVSDYENDTILSFASDLLGSINYRFDIDELGRILFVPNQDSNAVKPVWTFNDDNSSILYPEITIDRDLYGIPNVVEVMYSSETSFLMARAENNDENSPTSIPVRGREVMYRLNNPDDLIAPDQYALNEYAKNLLRDLSTLEYTISYSHGYCPVRVGDCVMLNYTRAGLVGIKAIVKSQEISCETGCKVTETATYTKKLWG